jgi:hypothetical protein
LSLLAPPQAVVVLRSVVVAMIAFLLIFAQAILAFVRHSRTLFLIRVPFFIIGKEIPTPNDRQGTIAEIR